MVIVKWDLARMYNKGEVEVIESIDDSVFFCRSVGGNVSEFALLSNWDHSARTYSAISAVSGKMRTN